MCVYVKKKRFRGTLLTEEEYRVLTALLKCGRVSDAARVLGKAQPTVSIVKKRIEEKIERALETVKLALSLGILDREAVLELLSSVEGLGAPAPRGAGLLEEYLGVLGEVADTVINKRAPGLLELLELVRARGETRIRAVRVLVEKPGTRLLASRAGRAEELAET